MWKFILWVVAKIVEYILRRRKKPRPKKGSALQRILVWFWQLIKKWLSRRRR